ncbi:methylamine utilization protein MauE [Microtetraspora sp. AC03309]|uniref:MauE/DoxX family redox-associated membrane protein n=1 Tax=Microtetraspora sp. AC03309 TaxID=2779376 RepID=UPI001E5CD36E|nr:MauE/DoxX family redox-associated membrane protein [Microtetraspora sp. AC03309]MCC5577543.1 methylamine utilization protein MauE [Microtetraspora sp. AC03309]
MEYVRAACATLIAVVFAASAVSKLRDFRGFARSLPTLAPVSARLVRPLALVVVAAETATPILLAVPRAASYGFALACALLTAFTAAIAGVLRRGRQATCRCFGASSEPVGRRHLVRNGALLISTVLGGLAPQGLPAPAGLAVAATAGVAGAILIISFDDVVDLFARSS